MDGPVARLDLRALRAVQRCREMRESEAVRALGLRRWATAQAAEALRQARADEDAAQAAVRRYERAIFAGRALGAMGAPRVLAWRDEVARLGADAVRLGTAAEEAQARHGEAEEAEHDARCALAERARQARRWTVTVERATEARTRAAVRLRSMLAEDETTDRAAARVQARP